MIWLTEQREITPYVWVRPEGDRQPESGIYKLVGARQTLQWVGQIKIGSSAQALCQTPNFRRHGKRSGTMPVLSSSPTSKSQFSGASWMGSHFTALHDIA
jgi:hypothetical protein